MDSADLDGLLLSFDDKISNVCGKLALLHRYRSQNRDECLALNNIIGSIQYMIFNVSAMLDQQEELLHSQMKRCEGLFTLVDAQSEYIEANISSLKVKSKGNHIKEAANIKSIASSKPKDEKPKSAPTITSRSTSARETSAKSIKKEPVPSVRKESANVQDDSSKSKTSKSKSTSSESSWHFPTMMPLSKTEFDSIPSYMLGRLSLDVLNEFASAFNSTIVEKYKFINSYTSQATNEENYKRFQSYKSQENSETKDVYFCTVNDIKELSSMKNDPTIRKALICLRHCKRIKENRGNPQKLIRYCLIN